MAFPVSPINGQVTVVNQVSYQYSSATNSWTRILSTANIITANTIAVNGALTVGTTISAVGNITAGTGNFFVGNGSQLTGITADAAGFPISSGNSNIAATANGNIFISVAGTSNVAVFATTGEYITGVLSASGTITGGNLATGGTASATGNITGGNILTGGLISATGTITGSSHLGAVVSVTGNVTGGNVLTGGLISATANVTGGNVLTGGLISATSDITSAANITGGNVLTAGLVSATANVTGGNVLTGGLISATSDITSAANITGGNVLTGGLVSATANVTGGNVLTGGLVSATANVTGGNVLTGGLISATSTITSAANITGGNVLTAGLVSATGNVTGNFINGNGYFLTGIITSVANINNGTSNVNIAAANANVTVSVDGTANVAVFATTGEYITGVLSASGNVTGGNLLTGGLASVTGNVTGGNVLTAGLVSATGNVTGNFINGNGYFLTGIITSVANINNGTSNVNIASANANITVSVDGTSNVAVFATTGEYITGVLSASGNITGGNLLTAGLISATSTITSAANITGGNLLTGGLISATANVIGGNILTGGLISATATITSAANITGGNILTGGLISATGNITSAANVNTPVVNAITGNLLISATVGNINIEPNGNIVLAAGNTYINNVKSPVQSADAVNKEYVDNIATTGITYHQAVNVATTTTLATTTGGTITYAQPNGVANGIGATLTTTGSFNLIDTGNVQTLGTRILVKDQANAVQNGIYVWSNATVITRSADADQYGAASTEEISINDYFFVSSGNVNAGSAYVVDAPAGVITFGTSNIAFAQFSSSQTYTANTSAGISLAGTVFSAKVDNDTTAFDLNGNISVKASANLTTPNIGAATGTSLSATGNIQGGNVLTGGLISATSTITSAANITGGNLLTAGLISATSTITSAANITGGNLLTAGLISATANITGGNLLTAGLISATSTITSAANITGGNVLTGGLVSATGNVTGNYINGNGFFLTGIITSVANINNGTSNVNIAAANANVTVSVDGTANVAVFATTGEYITGVLSASGNVTGGNLLTGGLASVTGNVTGGNVLTAGLVSATGNVTGNFINGNGYFLTGIITSVANINNGTSNVNIASANANITVSVDGTSNVAVFATTGEYITGVLSASGNITGGNLLTAGLISATSTITSAANITGGNLLTGGLISATANVIGGNILTGGLISATATITSAANITGGNILTGGLISATGNITSAANVNTPVVNAITGNLLISATVGNINIEPNGNIVLAAGNTYINNVKSPVQSADAVNKEYVDNIATTGITYHQAVNVATTTTLATTTGGTITYAQPNGVANGIGATLTTTGSFNLIDTGNVQTLGTRILVKDQANAVQNGIYVWSNATVITRSVDADQYGASSTEEISINDYFFVSGGNVNAGSAYVVDAPAGVITFGTSNIAFAQFSSSQTYTANTSAGISLAGTVFSAKVDNDTTAFDLNGNISVKAGANLTTPNIGAATGTSLSATGNIQGGNLRTGGLISATSTITSAANITGGNILTSGQISATGNITANNINTGGTGGSISGTGNITAGNFFTGGVLSATGNVTGNFINGNGYFLTGIITSVANINNGTSNVNIAAANANVTVSVNGTSNVAVFATTGEYITGVLSASGNVTGGNVLTAGLISATSTITSAANITGGNVLTAGLISATSTITSAANITGGNVLTAGLVSATGNVTGNFINGNGYFLTGIITSVANINNGTSNVNIAAANANVTVSVNGTSNVAVFATTGEYITGVLSASGNVTGGNVLTAGLISATSTITSAANITGGNVLTAGLISATANITGGNVLTGGLVSATANITGGNLLTAGLISATGNIRGGNVTATNYYYANGIAIVNYTASGTPPASPTTGWLWYNTSTDVIYEYIFDGTTNYWVDISSPAFAGGVVANVSIAGSMLLNANSVYDLGSASQQLRDVYATNYYGNGATLSGIITSTANINNGTSNITVVSSGGNITTSVSGNANIGVWYGSGLSITGDLTVTGNATLSGNILGDRVQNGTTSIDIQTAGGNANINIGGTGNLAVFAPGNLFMTGNLTPTANVTYDLGTSTQRWKDLWLSGSSIQLGNSTISANATAVVITNPAGGTTVLAGTSGASSVTGAVVSATGNITGGNVLTGGLISATGNIFGGNISLTGDVTAQNVNSLSDAVLKDNINPLIGADAIINGLFGVEYDWKNGSGHSYGLLAQDVEKVLPDAVKTNDAGLKSVNYIMIIPFLVETIKKLGSEVAELKKKKSPRSK